ncbi:MAG: orotate phosphoribosyltransferase, partial [Clostridium paraputrificum]|nr:orotate phosphoribosyltransferase [Clostridium paraputrificum]
SALVELQEKYGFKACAIVTMEEVIEYLYNREVNGKVIINDEIKARIDSYYEQYGAK